jgi:hypothetical protein
VSDQRPARARYVYQAVWTVDLPPHPDGPLATVRRLDPIAPSVMRQVIQMTAERILASYQDRDIRVGAVSVTGEPDISTGGWVAQSEPQEPEGLRYQYRAPGPEQTKTTGTYTAQTFATGELEPQESDELDPADGYHQVGECPCGQAHTEADVP